MDTALYDVRRNTKMDSFQTASALLSYAFILHMSHSIHLLGGNCYSTNQMWKHKMFPCLLAVWKYKQGFILTHDTETDSIKLGFDQHSQLSEQCI